MKSRFWLTPPLHPFDLLYFTAETINGAYYSILSYILYEHTLHTQCSICGETTKSRWRYIMYISHGYNMSFFKLKFLFRLLLYTVLYVQYNIGVEFRMLYNLVTLHGEWWLRPLTFFTTLFNINELTVCHTNLWQETIPFADLRTLPSNVKHWVQITLYLLCYYTYYIILH